MMALVAESDMIHAVWSGEEVSYTGTVTAPANQIAKSVMVQSALVRAIRPTRSPGPIPEAIRPLAIAVTRSCICAALMGRSEEHTSELQSRGHLVCRLLLGKKNNPSDSEHR